MGRNAGKAVGAQGRLDAHMIDPDALTIIEDDPKHPLYDGLGAGLPIPEETILNYMEYGIQTPIKARRAGEKNGKPILEVIFGRDRVRGARLANKELKKAGKVLLKVPVIFTRGDDKKMFGIMLSENVHRKELSPLYRATQMQRFFDFGATEAEVMRDLRISVGTVRNYKAMLECSTKVKKALDNHQISGEAVIELSKLSHADQDKALEEMVASGATKGMKAKEAAQNARQGKKAKPATTSRMFSRKKMETAAKKFLELKMSWAPLAANLIAAMLGNDGALKALPDPIRQILKEVRG